MYFHYPHFTDEETEVYRCYITCPRLQLKICGERGFYRFERDEDDCWVLYCEKSGNTYINGKATAQVSQQITSK